MSGVVDRSALDAGATGLEPVELGRAELTLSQLERVAAGATVVVRPTDDGRARFDRSREVILEHVTAARPVYGINVGFGGMSDVAIAPEDAALLQRNAVLHNRAGAGAELPERHVRAGMLLRLNSHLRGVSGLRWELVERLATFLNAGATPVVRELGSIGASGDLIPLSAITRVVTGVDPGAGVRYRGERITAAELLSTLGLEPLELEPKEGLAMVNGTSVSTGIAACCVVDAGRLLSVTLGFHALAVQALCGSSEPFDPFVHRYKPYAGQVWIAGAIRDALAGTELADRLVNGGEHLAQDRYSIRCLPQFLGPAVDVIRRVGAEIELEMNSATDNPLVDAETNRVLHCGNFLAQYVATGLDALRAQLALVVQHVDVQLALMFAPEFSNGLPASLVGNTAQPANMGLKALQTSGNSIMPLVAYHAAPLADRFPTHAEQFNQNVNSQSYGAAHLTCEQLRLASHHLAIALLCAMQAVELRSARLTASHDPRRVLSESTVPLYEELCGLVGRQPVDDRPYCFDDGDVDFEAGIDAVADDLRHGQRLAGVTRLIGLEVPVGS